MLNLGTVGDLAEVSVNGKALGILWKSPYQVDVTGALKPGANQLEIKVTNEWTNRLIGDRSAPPEKRVLAGSPAGGIFGAPQTLGESGLLGPVTFVSVGEWRCAKMKSPPTGVGGLSKSNLRKRGTGSIEIPPTAVGGLFRSNRRKVATDFSLKPTSSSWRIVQIPSLHKASEIKRIHGNFWLTNRLDLNDPPTSVGGIQESRERIFFRLDLKHPPTAVGGIQLSERAPRTA